MKFPITNNIEAAMAMKKLTPMTSLEVLMRVEQCGGLGHVEVNTNFLTDGSDSKWYPVRVHRTLDSVVTMMKSGRMEVYEVRRRDEKARANE